MLNQDPTISVMLYSVMVQGGVVPLVQAMICDAPRVNEKVALDVRLALAFNAAPPSNRPMAVLNDVFVFIALSINSNTDQVHSVFILTDYLALPVARRVLVLPDCAYRPELAVAFRSFHLLYI